MLGNGEAVVLRREVEGKLSAMSWIRTVRESDARGELAELYAQMAEPVSGSPEPRVDNILKIHSLHPEGLEAHWKLYTAVMRGTPTLRKVDREMIALVVSQLNECHY